MQHLAQVHKSVTAAKVMGVYGGVIAVLLMLCIAGSPESSVTVFGPQDFVRVAGQPATTTVSFPARSPALGYTLHIDNGGSRATFARVTSAVVSLNGVQIAGPSDFGQTVRVLDKPVTLAATNTLTVELRGAPGSGFTLQIVGTGRPNTPPVANAGPSQTVFVNIPVQLDGSQSSDADGNPLTYRWSLRTIPTRSTPTLSAPTAVHPTFTVDRPGTYIVQLMVNDGTVDSPPATVTISTTNSPPVANAGPAQTVFVGMTVHLDGSQSSDVDGDALTYRWSFTALPTGSAAMLANPTAVAPIFVVDHRGTYVAQLIVNDGTVDSAPTTVTISTENSPPVANAGPAQTVFVGTTVHLDGSRSSDVDGDPLTYRWSFTALPAGSATVLSNPTAVAPTFVVDHRGTYVAQLIVNDGTVDSAPTTVTISTTNSPPVANAGPAQTVFVGTTVRLDGSRSSDVDGDALTYRWSFTALPTGSIAVLADPLAVTPTFVLDRPGAYVVQLIVNDGTVDSAPATVTISTTNSSPVANAGPNQTVFVGTTGRLDGSRSSDVDGDPLTYRWSFTALPAGSAATLANPTAVAPTFVVDRRGTYVAQLIVNDGTLDSLPATVTITTQNSRPVADAGVNQIVLVGTTVRLDGSASSDVDGDPLTFRWALTTVPTDSAATLSAPTTVTPTFGVDQAGTYVAQLIVNDGTLDSVPVTVTITANAPPPPPLNTGQLTLSGIINGTVTATGAPGAAPAGATVTLTNTRTGQTVTGTVQANGSFTLQVAAQGGDTLSFTVIDASGQSSLATTVTVSAGSIMAPPLDRTVATDLASATAFLYTGSQPMQTGVAAGAIEPRRVAVLRGQVRTRDGASLPGVAITIGGHPEYGSTLTRADGLFDLAVNGGGLLSVRYEKAPYLPVQRQVQTPWQDYVWLPDVVMIPYDTQRTTIDLTTATDMQVAQGSVQTDADGTRQATLLFAPGTQASMVLPDGSSRALTTLDVRATEYTVGPHRTCGHARHAPLQQRLHLRRGAECR